MMQINDKWFIRMKDIIIIFGALTGFLIGLGKFYQKPFELQVEINGEKEKLSKIIPMVEIHEKEIALIQSEINYQYREIQKELLAINKKLNR